VLGAGQMGTGIAKVMITTAKIPVQIFDTKFENAKKAEAFVRMFVQFIWFGLFVCLVCLFVCLLACLVCLFVSLFGLFVCLVC
jgi:hypothetical protein